MATRQRKMVYVGDIDQQVEQVGWLTEAGDILCLEHFPDDDDLPPLDHEEYWEADRVVDDRNISGHEAEDFADYHDATCRTCGVRLFAVSSLAEGA